MSKPQPTNLFNRFFFSLSVVFVSLVSGYVAFIFLITFYFIFLAPPGPFESISQGSLQVSGPIISKDDDYLVIDRQGCNTDDCHMLGTREMRFGRKSFDFFEPGETVTVYVNGVNESPLWFDSTVEPAAKYRNIYNHSRIDKGNTISSSRGVMLGGIGLLTIGVALAIGYWLSRFEKNVNKVIFIFLSVIVVYVLMLMSLRFVAMMAFWN